MLPHFSHWGHPHKSRVQNLQRGAALRSPKSKGDQHRLHHKLTLLSLSFFTISSSSSLALTRSFSSSAADIVTAKTAWLLQEQHVPVQTPASHTVPLWQDACAPLSPCFLVNALLPCFIFQKQWQHPSPAVLPLAKFKCPGPKEKTKTVTLVSAQPETQSKTVQWTASDLK